jgi:hypothetical protein
MELFFSDDGYLFCLSLRTLYGSATKHADRSLVVPCAVRADAIHPTICEYDSLANTPMGLQFG